MSSALAERWQLDRTRCLSRSGNLDIPALLASWFADPSWLRTARAIRPGDRRAMLADMAAETVEQDVGRYASELRWNLTLVEWLWSGAEQMQLIRDHTEYLFSALSDSLDFLDGSPADTSVEYYGVEFLEAALREGRGVILAAAYQSHPGYALASPCLGDCRVGVVRRSGPATGDSMTLSGLTNVRELAANVGAVRPMLQLLSQGQAVAAYCDFVYAGSAKIDSTLFGHRVPIAKSLISIAISTRAAIVPLAVARVGLRDSSRVIVEFFPSLGRLQTDKDAASDALALHLGLATECLIRRYPAQWRLWNTLRDRCSRSC
jgi:lauroyl/myristoyl acyltransferase